ncbi:MAG: HAMP domain-containing protein [Chloroflexi bacterium]|nr:HAMP domain-containing protein [Chloroflexota bacterium]
MRSLGFKLALAFLAVALSGVAIVALSVARGAESQFSSYLQRGSTQLRVGWTLASLRVYYAEKGSWKGVEALLRSMGNEQEGHFLLTDGKGRVIADSTGQLTDRLVDEKVLGTSFSITVEGKPVGTLHFLPWDASLPAASAQRNAPAAGMMGLGVVEGDHMEIMSRMMGGLQMTTEPLVGPPEQDYLAAVKNSLWLGGAVAASAAVLLGLLLTRYITRPLTRVTAAAQAIARGDLSQRVTVSSGDEIGELGAAFNAMAETLAMNEKQRRQMVADIAHELRTPLSIIQGNLEAMVDGFVPPNREQLSSLHQESQFLSRLVSDLRELSLMEAGQLKMEKSSTDLGTVIQRSVEKVSLQGASKNISLEIDMPPLLAPVLADAHRLEQVLGNLLDNALRHTPSGGKISLKVNTEGRNHVVSISDTGHGIAAADLPFVFDRFYRADKSRSRATGGSGIGLAVVKQLVQAHGGKVWVESQEGKGSTFYFSLPLIVDLVALKG